jgi:hypothetical protein
MQILRVYGTTSPIPICPNGVLLIERRDNFPALSCGRKCIPITKILMKSFPFQENNMNSISV